MSVDVLDLEPAAREDQHEIVSGLSRAQKEISPKYFYDERGSQLFEQICEQPEYYPTRTELGIMRDNIGEITGLIESNASIIEFGSGASIKTRLLLQSAHELAAYVPVDISRDHLAATAEKLSGEFPDIEILPVCADFTKPFDLPNPSQMPDKNVVYFPGSTIGNFSTREAIELMKVMRGQAKDDGALLIGVDIEKPRDVLERAYNDAAGVTAEFNLNLLTHLNREYGADFDVDAFEHEAVYDDEQRRIEMRLISREEQSVQVAGAEFEFDAGEYIVTEHSHKYPLERFASMAADAGFDQQQCWIDENELFSVQYLVAA